MKKPIILIVGVCIASLDLNAQTHEVLWAKSLKTYDIISSEVVTDDFNNIYIGGEFQDSIAYDSSVMFTNDFSDGFIYKLNPNGDLIWQKQLNADFAARVTSLTVDNENNLIIAAAFYSDINIDGLYIELDSANYCHALLLKLSADGNYMWHRLITGNCPYPNHISTDNDNNVIITGNLGENLYTDTEPEIIYFDTSFVLESLFFPYRTADYIAKYNSAGSFLWAKQFNTIQNDDISPTDIKTDNQNNIYFYGSFNIQLKFEDIEAVFPIPEGTYYITRVNPSGEIEYLKYADTVSIALSAGNFDLCGNEIVMVNECHSNSGQIYIEGNLVTSTYSESVSTFNLDGEYIGTIYVIEGTARGVEINKINNGYLLSQSFSNHIDLGDTVIYEEGAGTLAYDIVALKINDIGEMLWIEHIPLSSAGNIYSQVQDENDDLVIFGNFNEQVQIGEFILERPHGPAQYDGFIAKIKDYTAISNSNSNVSISVYPNPFNDLFNIYLSDISTADILDIRLYNLSGQKIPIVWQAISLSTIQMSMMEDTPGMYILQLITNENIYETTIIKL